MIPPNFLFNTTLTHRRKIFGHDHGDVAVLSTTDTDFSARLHILSGSEALRQGCDRTKYIGRVYCDASVEIYEGDDIIDASGREWKVIANRNPGEMNVYRVIDVERPIVERHEGVDAYPGTGLELP